MRHLAIAIMAAMLAVPAAAQDEVTPDEQELHNVALTTLGATAKGYGAPWNKDWPAINALKPGSRGGALFGAPMTGATMDIRLVVPVDIKAIEVIGLDYHSTRQPGAIDISVDGEFIKNVELPDTPGEPARIPLDAHGQHVQIKVTDEHPVRVIDGKEGPTYGGWQRVRVLSPVDVETMMADIEAYDVPAAEVNIAPTGGSAAGEEVAVHGEPRQTVGHPCTIWDGQDIERYKQMIETSDELRTQYEGLLAAMNKRIEQPLGIPQPKKNDQGEWMHLPAGEYGGTHNQLAVDIANLGAAYQLSGDRKYAEFAKRLLLGYADVYDKYAPGNRPGFRHDQGKCFDQRLGDSTWLIQVARGYDLIYNLPSISDDERTHIEDDLVRASARFIAGNRAHLISPTNWSAIGTCAVLMAGYATDDRELVDLAMYGPGGTKENPRGGVMLHFGPRSIDADGMWAEGAMGYQFMALEALIADAEVLWHHGIDLYRHRDAALKRLFDSPLEYSYPDLKTPAIHDSGHGSIVGRESFLYEFAYRRYRDPKYLIILKQTKPHLATRFQQFPVSVLYDLDPEAEAEAVEWESVNFFGVGYGILRQTIADGTISLLMDYGPNRSHGHPDKLNIDLWAMGERLVPDPGSTWYERPLYRRWYSTTVAHNTLCVDELNQRPAGADQLVYGPATSIAIQRARTNEAYAGVLMDRSLFMTPRYVADLFGAFGRVPRKMDLCWHPRGEFTSTLDLEPTELPEPRENGYNELAALKHATTTEPYTCTTEREDGFTARLVAAGGAETEVLVGRGHLGLDRPPAILQRRQADKTLYGNAIDLSDAEEPFVKSVMVDGSVDDGYGLLTIETADGTDLCFAAYAPGTHSAGGLATDAQQAFVVRDGDTVTGAYLGGGTTLEVEGLSLERSAAGLAYLERAETGAWIVGNPSPAKAAFTIDHPDMVDMQAYRLDADGRRTGSLPMDESRGYLSFGMESVSQVEFAPEGVPSVYKHRQAMLRKRAAEQEAALKAAEKEAKARTAAREKAAQADPLPGSTLVVVQAEDFSAQGGGEVGVGSNKTGIVGEAFSGWDGVGHWVEWTIDAPHAGYYHLTLKYCSALALCERELKVNGEVIEPFGPIIFPGTGGWANGSDDWRLFTVPNPVAEHPLLIKLDKGANTIRMTNANGRGVNLDYLAVHGPDVKPTREILEDALTQQK